MAPGPSDALVGFMAIAVTLLDVVGDADIVTDNSSLVEGRLDVRM